jgi:hypothetical protein
VTFLAGPHERRETAVLVLTIKLLVPAYRTHSSHSSNRNHSRPQCARGNPQALHASAVLVLAIQLLVPLLLRGRSPLSRWGLGVYAAGVAW